MTWFLVFSVFLLNQKVAATSTCSDAACCPSYSYLRRCPLSASGVLTSCRSDESQQAGTRCQFVLGCRSGCCSCPRWGIVFLHIPNGIGSQLDQCRWFHRREVVWVVRCCLAFRDFDAVRCAAERARTVIHTWRLRLTANDQKDEGTVRNGEGAKIERKETMAMMRARKCFRRGNKPPCACTRAQQTRACGALPLRSAWPLVRLQQPLELQDLVVDNGFSAPRGGQRTHLDLVRGS